MLDGEEGRVYNREVGEVPSQPKWRNWQTRGIQNPVALKGRVGSIPTFGTSITKDLPLSNLFLVKLSLVSRNTLAVLLSQVRKTAEAGKRWMVGVRAKISACIAEISTRGL